MLFTSDFPGGNGTCIAAREREWGWEIEFLAESKAREPQPLWFHFRLSALTGEKVRLRLANSDQCLGDSQGWSRNQPVFRCADGPWKRLPAAENTWTEMHRLNTWFEVPLTGDEMEFAFCYPYTMLQLEETLKSCPCFRKEIIGYSSRQRPLYRISSDPRTPGCSGIYLLGRQHSGEVSGSWVMDGMLRYLSGPEGSAARERFHWWFVPFADVDGVEEGFYGKDQVYHDLNRAWHPHFPSRTELVSVEHDLRHFHRACHGRLMLDLHGPGHAERESYFVVHADTTAPHRAELRAIQQEMNRALGKRALQAIDFQEKPQGNNTSAQTGQTSAVFVHQMGMNGCTIEFSYQGERSGRPYDLSDYAVLGACLVQGIMDALKED